MTDAELKEQLLELARTGAPRPSADSELGRALERFCDPDNAAFLEFNGEPNNDTMVEWACDTDPALQIWQGATPRNRNAEDRKNNAGQ